MRLLADCGNSTIKLALAHDGGVWIQERLNPELDILSTFVRTHASGGAALDELALLPGSAAHAALVAHWWKSIAPGRPMRVLGRELPVPAVGQYATCGLDRVVAGVIACAQQRGPVLVIDAGTATTFSAWHQAGATDAILSTRFAGGLILPGARACIVGLAHQAPALPVVDPAESSASACQFDTPGSIAAAIGIGYVAMVEACLRKLREETGIANVVVTGGNAAPLLGAVVPRLAYRPSLVLEGLEMICRSTDTAAAQ